MKNLTRQGRHQQTRIKVQTEDGLVTEEVVDIKDIPLGKAPVDPETGKRIPIDHESISKAEIAERAMAVIAQAKDHYLEWEGPWAVCQSCPYRHSVPLDFMKFDLVNGKPVKKEPLA